MRTLCLLPVIVTSLLGCSGDDESDSALARVEGFCQEWAARACNADVVDRCSATDADACRTAQAVYCESIVPAGKYDPAEAKACLDAVEEAYADADLDAEERSLVRELGAPCDRVLSGDAGPGESCTDDSDCSREAGLSCIIKGGMGTCQEAVVAGGGEQCDADDTTCGDGFYCDGTNCLADRNAGSECSTSVPCAAALNCELPDGAEPGPDDTGASCVPRLSVGEDCEKATDCVSGICSMLASGGGVCAASVFLAPTEPICEDLR